MDFSCTVLGLRRALTVLMALSLLGLPVFAQAAGGSFPADAGTVNVKTYGAVGDGVKDDTAALLAAIRAADVAFGTAWWRNRIVYFPEGTYLISDTLTKRASDGRYLSGMVLVGASRQSTTLKLKNYAPGYSNPQMPKAVIYTSSTLLTGLPTAGGKDYAGKGEGNDAYANYVENMNIDVGAGNPGAIAIDYLANNMGALRNLSIVAPALSGAIGVSLDRKWPGPALISNVSVTGFDVGISASQTEYGVTLDKISLAGQRSVALRNNANSLSIGDLSIDGVATGIQNLDPKGLITAVGLKFSGGSSDAAGIENAGSMTLRRVRTDRAALFFGLPLAAGAEFEGVYQGNARVQSATPRWAMPVKSAPAAAASDPPASWANVQSYGAVPDGITDSSAAVQQALKSGASTIYFPFGAYAINDSVEVPPSVRRIEGMMSTIKVTRYNSAAFWLGGGIFKVTSGGEPLLIQRMAFDMINKGGKLAIEYSGSAPLILRDVVAAGIALVNRSASGGELYAENICSGPMTLAGSSGAWIRQLDTEGTGIRIVNNGSPLWILGIKTEQNATILWNGAGSQTEVMGGLLYLVQVPATQRPAFVNIGGRLVASYVESSYRDGATYDVQLLDQTPGAERTVLGSSSAARGLGRMVPLLSTPFD